MGPVAAKSYPGQELVKVVPEPDDKGRMQTAQRAKQEIDYGRREKGYIYGALQPINDRALTEPYEHRNAALWTDFLKKVDAYFYLVKKHYYAKYFDEADMTLQTKKNTSHSFTESEVLILQEIKLLILN
jgi:hypothetical protein